MSCNLGHAQPVLPTPLDRELESVSLSLCRGLAAFFGGTFRLECMFGGGSVAQSAARVV